MYKLSVAHSKIFCDFFASTVGFRQNSVKFPTKPAGNRLPNFLKIRLINSAEFHISKNLLFLSHVSYILTKKNQFSTIFSKFLKIDGFAAKAIFPMPTESCNTEPNTTIARSHQDKIGNGSPTSLYAQSPLLLHDLVFLRRRRMCPCVAPLKSAPLVRELRDRCPRRGGSPIHRPVRCDLRRGRVL
jgi:hypothetical protein